MGNYISKLVEMFFEDIPYSEEIRETQQWRHSKKTKGMKTVKKEITGQRRWIYLISFLWLFTGVYLIEIPLVQSFFPLLFAGISGLLAYFFHKKYRKREETFTTARQYDTEAYLFLCTFSDKYAKRTLNGIAVLFAVAAAFLTLELNFYIFHNSKVMEFRENIYANLIFLEIPAYICIKNMFCFRLSQRRINFPDKGRYKKHLIGISIFSAAYWLIVTALILILKMPVRYPVNFVIMAGILFVMFIFLYNLKFRKKVTYKNIVVNQRRVAAFAAAAILMIGYMAMQRETWYTQPYINATPIVEHNHHDISYQEQTGVYTITMSTDDFKILHLTDIHLGGSLYSYRKDIKALQAVYDEIEHTKPDLVVVTGDLTFPLGIMSMSLNNAAPVSQFAAFMRNIGIPWVFTYGNHDTESLAALSERDLNDLYKQLSYKTSGNLLYPYVQPDVTGRNNQLVEVRNRDGTLNQAIFLIDSNACISGGINVYDYIHDDQVEWYANQVERLNAREGHLVPSMVFFHIPLQEYRTAYELYEQGSDEVKYFFGENGEKMINKVCCSDYPSKLFDTMQELGSTKAVFCGHDHYNNMSLEYRGIRLTYGMSIDYLAMPGIENDTKQRGAELITLHSDSSWEIEQIPLSSIQDQKKQKGL